jgi:hypothetical protein
MHLALTREIIIRVYNSDGPVLFFEPCASPGKPRNMADLTTLLEVSLKPTKYFWGLAGYLIREEEDDS